MMTKSAARGWMLYDGANSAYVTLVTTIGGPFLTAMITGVYLAGQQVQSATVYSVVLALAVLAQLFVLPLAAAAGESPRGRLALVRGATVTGSFGIIGVGLTPSSAWWLGALALVVGQVSFGVAVMAYNAMLTDLTREEDRARLSSRGFATGYVGGGLVLAGALAALMVMGPSAEVVRVALVAAGLWWLVLGLLAMRLVAPALGHGEVDLRGGLRRAGSDLRQTVRELRELPQTRRYLVSYLLFNDSIQSVVALAGVFLTQQLYVAQGRDASEATGFLLTLMLVIQLVASLGALLFEGIGRFVGPMASLRIALLGWVAVILLAMTGVETSTKAWVLGIGIALVLGGSQGLARALYSSMVPSSRSSSFFALYSLVEKGSAWVGPVLFGVTLQLTGSQTTAIASLLLPLAVGTGILMGVRLGRGRMEAELLETRLEGARTGEAVSA